MKSRQRESGQALVAATFGLVVLLGCAGLAVDVGYLRYQQRLQQSAAGNATAAAREDALLNGYTNGVNNVTVTVNPAFPFGAVTGVQVQVSAVHPTFFMRIFGVNNATVSTTAVAIDNSAKNCVYALNGFGTAINNNATVTATGCGIMDDGNLLNTGSITALSVGVHGTAAGGATIPGAITGIVEAGDPLYRLTAPGGGGGCQPNGNITGTGFAPPLNPGRYCTGITVTGSKNVTLRAGTYLITGTGISLNGTGTITGTGVTLYVAAGGGPVAADRANHRCTRRNSVLSGPRKRTGGDNRWKGNLQVARRVVFSRCHSQSLQYRQFGGLFLGSRKDIDVDRHRELREQFHFATGWFSDPERRPGRISIRRTARNYPRHDLDVHQGD